MVQEADMVEEEGEVKMVRQAQGHPPHTHTHTQHAPQHKSSKFCQEPVLWECGRRKLYKLVSQVLVHPAKSVRL